MSTRASIKLITNNRDDMYVYHHCDGGMWFVGIDLIKRIQTTLATQGRLWRDDFANELIKDKDCDYEITSGIHGDEEYFYELNFNNHTLRISTSDDDIFVLWDNAEELEQAKKWEQK